MSEFNASLADEVLAACQAGTDETAEALGRALDGEFAVSIGEAGSFATETLPEGWDGPGLIVAFQFGEVGAVAALPLASGLVPDWCVEPDATGESKLSTLAQELSMLLVPEEFMADVFEAAYSANIGESIAKAAIADEAGLVPVQLSSGEKKGNLTLVWPANAAQAALAKEEDEAPEETSSDETNTPAEAPAWPPPVPTPEETGGATFSQLPNYSRSLLQVQVPVIVHLAETKYTVGEIIEFGPGSIIKFDKSCEEQLELWAGNRPIAKGDVVKVGEQFGLRISTMLLPDERFKPVRPDQAKAG